MPRLWPVGTILLPSLNAHVEYIDITLTIGHLAPTGKKGEYTAVMILGHKYLESQSDEIDKGDVKVI